MTNFNVRIVGTANVTQMEASFAKLEAQVSALNKQLAAMVSLQKTGVDARGYEALTKAATQNSKTFRNAAASTGMFEVQQLRLNKATDDYTTKLQKQKVSLAETFRGLRNQSSLYRKTYEEQLKMENMVARAAQSGVVHGKTIVDTSVPQTFSKDINEASKRIGYFNQHLKSGATQMINWGKNTQWAGRQLTVGLSLPLAAVGAAAGVMAYQVDQGLTRVQKVYNTTAKDAAGQQKELDAVRTAGLKSAETAASQYGSAAQDTLNVQAELAAAGQRGAALQKNTVEVMRISRLGELDYNDAIKSTISLQTVFRQSSEELTKSFNYMNAIENATSLQTEDFARAIPIAAAPVKAFGGNIQELGILLTAMKSRGIEATQGANAIKAAMQRLGRPSKTVQEEWTALTKTDITQIFDKSTSLIDLFSRIRDATKDLGKKDQIKAFAGLFGTYQVTRMMALVNGMKDLHDETTQTGTAFKIAGDDAGSWAKVAATEIDRYKNSISGKWDRAINEMKLQLSTLGKPFVEVATGIITQISRVIKAFNSLPDVGKQFIAIPIILGGIAGPLIMLTGLFANLGGNILKLSSFIIGLKYKFQVQTAAEKAATLVAKQNAAAMIAEVDAATLLQLQLEKLTLAQQLANREQRRAVLQGLVNSGVPAREAVRQVNLISPLQSVGKSSKVVEQTSTKATANWKALAGYTAMAAASMAVMNTSSNGTVQKIAQIALMASLFGPLLSGIGPKMAAGFTAAKVAAAEAQTTMGGLRAGAAAFAAEMSIASLGMVAVVAVVAAGAFAWYKWHQHQQQVIDDQISAQKAITNTATGWADAMGVVEKHYQRISFMQSNIQGAGTDAGRFQKDLDYYQSNTTGQASVGAFKNLSPDKQTTAATKLYSDLIVKMGLSAKQAQANVTAFLVASGRDFFTATRQAAQLGDALGNVSGHLMDWRDTVRVGGQYLLDIANNSDKSAAKVKELEDATTGFAQTFSAAFSQTKTPAQAKHLMDELSKTVLNGWTNILAKIKENPVGADFLKANKIDTAKDLETWARTNDNTLAGPFKEMLENQKKFENSLVNSVGYSLGLGKNYSWIDSLLGDMLVKTRQMSLKGAQKEALNLAKTISSGPLGGILGTGPGFASGVSTNKGIVGQFKAAARAMPTSQLDAMATNLSKIAAAQGIEQSTVPWKQLSYILDGVKVGMADTGKGAKKAAGDVKGVQGALDGLPSAVGIQINAQQSIQVVHDAMSAVQDDMVTSAQNSFNSRWDATMSSEQDMWSARESSLQDAQAAASDALQRRQSAASEALQRRQQNASDALDKHFQKREDAINKAYQKRIDAVQNEIKAEEKADEKRQAMFEAEKARLQKLADMANANIDFNTAINTGDFDEAAKIRNNIEAQAASDEMDREEAQAKKRSDARIDDLNRRSDRLEKERDKQLKQLRALEDAQKKALERMQQRQSRALDNAQSKQSKALEHSQQVQSDALKKREDADMASMQKTRDYEEAMLNQRLDLFKTYIAKNQRDLNRWMRQVGLTYDDFGSDVKAKGESWASFFQKSLRDHIHQAGMQVVSDNMWEGIGKKMAGKLVKGIGFKSLSAFQKFVDSGKYIDVSQRATGGHITRHTGGPIDYGSGGRGDVPRGYRGMHPSEMWVKAQMGEYMLSKETYAKNKGVVDAMQAGTDVTKRGIGGVGDFSGIPIGMTAAMFKEGAGKGIRARAKYERAASKATRRDKISGGFKAGPGGHHRPVAGPVTNGLHDQSTGYAAVDMAGPVGRPVYAVMDGTITQSYDITGYEPRRPGAQDGYRSYGRVIYEKTDGGPTVLFAHLNKRSVASGQRVKGGSVIGYSGNTGNSTGPHLHFGDSDGNPYEFLRKGGQLRWDNTPVMAHKGETMLTAPLTKHFKDNVASGGGNSYSVTVNVPEGSTLCADEVADLAVMKLKRMEARRPSRGRRGG